MKDRERLDRQQRVLLCGRADGRAAGKHCEDLPAAGPWCVRAAAEPLAGPPSAEPLAGLIARMGQRPSHRQEVWGEYALTLETHPSNGNQRQSR